MNQASREKRNLLFFPESESDLKNKLGPGPAKYNIRKGQKFNTIN